MRFVYTTQTFWQPASSVCYMSYSFVFPIAGSHQTWC